MLDLGVREALTTAQFARAVGVSYRVADYWARNRVLRPSVRNARGSGSVRLYSEQDVRVGRALAVLAHHGATADVLAKVAADLRAMPVGGWAGRLFVDDLGRSGRHAFGRGGWVVDLGRCAGLAVAA